MTLEEMENMANRLIKQGETELAIKQIYDLVLAWAKKKDFPKAEKWRNKIIELDAMALTEILTTEEVISMEKENTIDFYHQKTWASLYIGMTQDEGNAFYLKLKQREYPPGKVLIKQGTINNTLFLIDSGQLKNIFSQDGKEIFLNDFGQSNTVGHDTFFNNSISTSTVVTSSPVKLMFLSRKAMQEVEEQVPGLTEKIKQTCIRLEAKSYKTLIKNKSLERRQHERHKISGKVSVQIFDKDKKVIGTTFQGSLDDVSKGGASFCLAGKGKDVGRSLLGRMTTLTLKNGNDPEIVFQGFILGAKFDQKKTYTINLKFFKPLAGKAVTNIVAKFPSTTD